MAIAAQSAHMCKRKTRNRRGHFSAGAPQSALLFERADFARRARMESSSRGTRNDGRGSTQMQFALASSCRRLGEGRPLGPQRSISARRSRRESLRLGVRKLLSRVCLPKPDIYVTYIGVGRISQPALWRQPGVGMRPAGCLTRGPQPRGANHGRGGIFLFLSLVTH
jgi:hypothetical protein